MIMNETISTLSFDEMVARLEHNILPIMQTWGKELEHDFENIQVKTNANRSDDHPRSRDKHFYSIYVICSQKGATKFPDYGDMTLSVDLVQHDEGSHPIISAEVGMLVDEEGEGDWGFNRIAKLFPDNQGVHDGIFEVLKKSLPQLYQSLRTALGKSGIRP
jgi:hypothetical protein